MIDKLLKVDSTKDNLVDQIRDLQERIAELERFALTSQDIVATNIDCSGDIYTVPWTDYSADSTIVGWSAFTTKVIYYKRVGDLVFCQFAIQGTSDVTTVSFTLLDDVKWSGSQVYQCLVYGIDSGNPLTPPARLDIPASGNIFNVYKDLALSAWTAASSTKGVRGEFWYESS